MILSALDTPVAAPQVMAFSVDTLKVEELRRALEQLVKTNDWKPLHKIGTSNRHELQSRVNAQKFQMSADWLKHLALNIEKAAQHMEISLDLANFHHELNSNERLEMKPWRFYAIAQSSSAPKEVMAIPKEELSSGLKMIMENRLRVAASALVNPESIEIPSYLARGPFDESIDHVVIPACEFEDEPTDEDIEFHRNGFIFAQISSYHLIEALTGPFTFSLGPGPFVEFPPQVVDLYEVPEVRHENFRTVDSIFGPATKVLSGKMLAAASVWFDSQPEPSLDLVDGQTAKQYWPLCRARFAKLMKSALGSGQSVLLMENELGHPFWFDRSALDR